MIPTIAPISAPTSAPIGAPSAAPAKAATGAGARPLLPVPPALAALLAAASQPAAAEATALKARLGCLPLPGALRPALAVPAPPDRSRSPYAVAPVRGPARDGLRLLDLTV